VSDPLDAMLTSAWPLESTNKQKKEDVSQALGAAREWLTGAAQLVREHHQKPHECAPYCIGGPAMLSLMRLSVAQLALGLFTALRILGTDGEELLPPADGGNGVNNHGPKPDLAQR